MIYEGVRRSLFCLYQKTTKQQQKIAMIPTFILKTASAQSYIEHSYKELFRLKNSGNYGSPENPHFTSVTTSLEWK